jgi:hypothetical protein
VRAYSTQQKSDTYVSDTVCIHMLSCLLLMTCLLRKTAGENVLSVRRYVLWWQTLQCKPDQRSRAYMTADGIHSKWSSKCIYPLQAMTLDKQQEIPFRKKLAAVVVD